MTPLERVLAAIQHKEADRVPCMPLIGGASRRVYGCSYEEWSKYGEIAAKSLLQAQDLLGFDAILTEIDLNIEAADLGQEMIFPSDDQSYPNYNNAMIRSPNDYLTNIRPVEPVKTERMSEHLRMCDVLMNERGDHIPVFGFVYGPLGILSVMRGPELLFADCMTYQEEIHHALSIITDVLEAYIMALSRTGIHAIWVETLFAGNKHMDKNMWLNTEGKYLRRLAAVTRKCGLMLMVHSSSVGFYLDAHMQTMRPEAVSCAWVPDGASSWPETKEKYGDKICIIGHVSPIQYLFLGSPEEVKEECKREIQELAKGGGFILAPGWEFPHNASLLNAKAMVEAVELYGRY